MAPASSRAERHDAVAAAILGLAPAVIASVPSASIAPLLERLAEAGPAAGARLVPVSREEEAMGLAGALPLTGGFGVVVMQDNGFGNALTALTTFPLAYHLPLLVVANTRGGLGEYNSMIHAISAPVPAMLAAAGIPVFALDRRTDAADWGAVVAEAGRHARMTYRPVVVLLELFDPAGPGGRA